QVTFREHTRVISGERQRPAQRAMTRKHTLLAVLAAHTSSLPTVVAARPRNDPFSKATRLPGFFIEAHARL
ncbi:MAG TPA: hypothetical protein PK640_19635, partial [Verrucomicrobiota bacterium]|nr:hypothetical protein [Verrucomicrobiota bacterium]